MQAEHSFREASSERKFGAKKQRAIPGRAKLTRARFAIEWTIAFVWQAGSQLRDRSIRTSQVNGVLAFVRA